jgi:hypothetical protein
MSRTEAGPERPMPRKVVAWSMLLVSVLLLASLFHSVVGRAVGEPTMTVSTIDGRSPATAALSDGDDVRARFISGRACDPSSGVCPDR